MFRTLVVNVARRARRLSVLSEIRRLRVTTPLPPSSTTATHPLSRTPKYYDEPAVYTVGTPTATEPYMVDDEGSSLRTGDEINVFFLGTSSASATRSRNVSSIAVKIPNQDFWVFDAGEGTNPRIQSFPTISPSSISKVFISHLHTDHVMGLPSLLVSIDVNSAKNCSIDIYGPLGLSQFICSALRFARPDTLSHISFHELIPANTPIEALPLRALYHNNLPLAQRCSKPTSREEPHTRRADRVSYYFADQTVDLSKHDPANNTAEGLINTQNVRHKSCARKNLHIQARQTQPITFTFGDIKVHAVLGVHSTTSWGWVIEEPSFSNFRKDAIQHLPPGGYLRTLKEGRAVAIVKPEYQNTSLFLSTNAKKQLKLPSLGPYSFQADLRNDPVLAPLIAVPKNKCDYLDLGPPPADPAVPVTLPEDLHPALKEHFTVVDPRGLVETMPGRKLALLFDCMGGDRMSPAAVRMCQGSDLLVHESTFFSHNPSVALEALRKAHSTAKIASTFATQIGAKALVLNHFSPRYRDDAIVGLCGEHVWLRHENGVSQVAVNEEGFAHYMSESLLSTAGHFIEAGLTTGVLEKSINNLSPASAATAECVSAIAIDEDVSDVDVDVDESLSDDGECETPSSSPEAESWTGLSRLRPEDQAHYRKIHELRHSVVLAANPPPNAPKAMLLAHDFMVVKVHRSKRR